MDVVPELLAQIQSGYQRRMGQDKRVNRINNRIRDGTANLMDAHQYAERSGVNLSNAYLENLTEDTLPNATLYYNIADRIVKPTLAESYAEVNSKASAIQKIADKKAKVGINATMADFPEDRIDGLIRKIAEEDTLEGALKWLKEPIVNNTEAFMDDFIRKNAEVREDMGLKATITRTVFPGCCAWCDKMAGTYEYGKEPVDIYRRHENCRCEVTYQTQRSNRSVWSKKTWEATPEEKERRKSFQPILYRR